MSAPSPPPPHPPLPPPSVDQSAWPTPPTCPGSQLCDADGTEMKRTSPKVFDVVFHTTTGDVRVRAWRDLAPKGADRLYNLARLGYYDASPLYRILPGFVAQFGVAADPTVSAIYDWRNDSPGAVIPDETKHASSMGNAKHWISYSASYDPSVRHGHEQDRGALHKPRGQHREARRERDSPPSRKSSKAKPRWTRGSRDTVRWRARVTCTGTAGGCATDRVKARCTLGECRT